MVKLKQRSLEYEAFEYLEHWKPVKKIIPADQLIDPQEPYFPLFSYLYDMTKKFYKQLPQRKNVENSFVHPMNVVLSLQKASIKDPVTLCAGLLHDYIEEKVDLYKKRNGIKSNAEGIILLDNYEKEILTELEKEIKEFCRKEKIYCSEVHNIILLLHLLTHQKRHFYYKYISEMLEFKDEELKEKALQIKLADRMHNVLCVECFGEEERIYQCFKNLFILNSVKKFLLDKYGKEVFTHKKFSPTARLFNKCARSTYDAFLTICSITKNKGIGGIVSMLQLAFKKFALEIGGLWVVTKVDDSQVHPFRLYQGVVRKYDARLNHEWDHYFNMKKKEMEYCKNFFAAYKFSEEQLRAVLDYKDAYSLKEVIAYLLYQPEYTVSKFTYADLSSKGRIKIK